ncbi:phage antirepressor KilAC domain-containing protein [Providencia rettgeri]|uniref:phage antirepressor KilAC domain-containing protein n=1 Tax=Providencia rettgeri TaxID=587 RepID=UPI0029409595|nr:phage antirepressor KilAC domain-containing protein [Providencia rettgeri]
MNQITTLVNNTNQTMSSLDFLDGIINPARIQAGETPHEPRKFLAKVEDELDLEVTGKKFRLNNNQTKTFYYDLTLDQLMLVGMRESKSVRRSVLEKLKQLEAPKIPQTLPEALRLAADLAEQKQIVEQQLAIAAPKAEFVDRYVQATGSLGFRETCKLLNVKENFFKEFLINKRIMYPLAGKLSAYSEHLACKRFEVKTGENPRNGHAFTQTKFTPKGIQWIAGLLAREQLEAA